MSQGRTVWTHRYCWIISFVEGIKELVNLFKLFQDFSLASNTDVLVFLNGPAYTRWTPALKPRDNAMTEFICDSPPIFDPMLNTVDYPSDYFKSMLRILEILAEVPVRMGLQASS